MTEGDRRSGGSSKKGAEPSWRKFRKPRPREGSNPPIHSVLFHCVFKHKINRSLFLEERQRVGSQQSISALDSNAHSIRYRQNSFRKSGKVNRAIGTYVFDTLPKLSQAGIFSQVSDFELSKRIFTDVFKSLEFVSNYWLFTISINNVLQFYLTIIRSLVISSSKLLP